MTAEKRSGVSDTGTFGQRYLARSEELGRLCVGLEIGRASCRERV